MAVKGSVTLADVAAASGVSTATVSRVLNRHPQIDNATRKKVYRVIEELGYENASINRRVSALSQAKVKTYSLELLLCPLSEQKNMLTLDFFREILNGIQSFFSQTVNVNMNLSTWASDDECNLKQNEMVFRRLLQADGVMIVGNPNRKLIADMVSHNVNFILVDSDREDCSVNAVTMDSISGGMLAARYLLDRGHVDIGFLSGPLSIYSWRCYRMGAMLAVTERVGINHLTHRSAASTENRDIMVAFKEWLDSGTCPRALIISHLDAAITVNRMLRERGMKCPEDFSIISASSEPREKDDGGTWTLIQSLPRQVGFKAAQRIMQMVSHPHLDDLPHRIVTPMKLIEGTSVKNLNCRGS